MGLIKKIKILALGTLFAASIVSNAHAQEPKPFGKIAGYYDTRGKSTATLILGASDLPLGTKFLGVMEFATEKDNPDNLTAPYGEFRLSKEAYWGLGVAAEYNRDFSQDKGTTRAGFVFEPNLKELLSNTFLGMKFYPASTHDQGIQLGVYGNTSFLDGDLTLDGFLDYNSKPGKVVTDLQVGYRLKDNLYAVVEGRYNGFLPKDQQLGAGLGLEWKF